MRFNMFNKLKRLKLVNFHPKIKQEMYVTLLPWHLNSGIILHYEIIPVSKPLSNESHSYLLADSFSLCFTSNLFSPLHCALLLRSTVDALFEKGHDLTIVSGNLKICQPWLKVV